VRKRRYISLLLLALLAFVQISHLHSFSHDEDASDCEICIVLQNSAEDKIIFAPASFQLEPQLVAILDSGDDIYIAFAKAESFQAKHTTRPPPVVA
jgi:hypothetical protein